VQQPIGVIGGSGFYDLLDGAHSRAIDTPFGAPSAPVALGELSGVPVAFLPRHGIDHRFAPHRVPYRANLWALRTAGVRQVVSLSAVGSLRPELHPGALVVPDQLVDRTSGRMHTYNDTDIGVAHVSFADPYCPRGRLAAHESGYPVVTGGTLVVINGPRFSTRAESVDYQRAGWTIIGMTTMPEASLARELALCYTGLTLVTDHDAGVESGHGVTQAEVFATFAANLPRLRELLVATLRGLPAEQGDCQCGAVYGSSAPPFVLP
jgi:5'-methylthioadenosine phosphorylase